MPYGQASFWEETLQTVERRSWPDSVLRLFFISGLAQCAELHRVKAGFRTGKTSGEVEGRWSVLPAGTRLHE